MILQSLVSFFIKELWSLGSVAHVLPRYFLVPAFKTDVPTSSTPTSPSLPPNIAAPRSTGKPLAMMAEMNKTKLATAKAAGTSKFGHVNKHKLGNGTDDSTSQVVKVRGLESTITPPQKKKFRAHSNVSSYRKRPSWSIRSQRNFVSERIATN